MNLLGFYTTIFATYIGVLSLATLGIRFGFTGGSSVGKPVAVVVVEKMSREAPDHSGRRADRYKMGEHGFYLQRLNTE